MRLAEHWVTTQSCIDKTEVAESSNEKKQKRTPELTTTEDAFRNQGHRHTERSKNNKKDNVILNTHEHPS